MKEHEIIIYNFVIFLVIYIASHLLANVYIRKNQSPSLEDNHLQAADSKKNVKTALKALHIIVLSLFVGMIGEILPDILKTSLFSAQVISIVDAGEQYLEAWIIFWSAIAILHSIEFIWRRQYEKRQQSFPIGPLLANIFRLLITFIIALWIVNYVLHWNSIHLLVSATALTAIAGFALKGTLGDLLAGASLHLSRSLLPSEWIQIPSINLEGEIIASNWRETRLRTTGGHIHILPNSFLSSNVFHNMSWPNSIRRHELNFILDAKSSPDAVETALLNAIARVDNVLQTPKPPQVIIKEYLEFGIRYQLRFWSDTYYDRSSIESNAFRAAWLQLDKQEIPLPFAMNTLLAKSLNPPTTNL